jgi:polar amino acid transport system permease protein
VTTKVAFDRVAYRQSRARRSTLIALVSTVVFAAVLLFAVTSSPDWPRVRDSFFGLRLGWDSLPALLERLWLNVRVLVVCQILILIVVLALAAVRTLRGSVWFPLRALVTGYIDPFRGLPLPICLYLVRFGLPGLRLTKLPTNPVVLGALALVLVYSAYVAEVFRARIESIHPSQLAAAKSLGLNYRNTMRLLVLPQSTPRVTPALLNDFVALQKDCGLISVLGAVDAVHAAQIQSAIDLLEEIDDGRSCSTAATSATRGSTPTRRARPWAWCFNRSTCFRTLRRWPTWHSRPGSCTARRVVRPTTVAANSLRALASPSTPTRTPDKLSGGQQQRVAIARALAYERVGADGRADHETILLTSVPRRSRSTAWWPRRSGCRNIPTDIATQLWRAEPGFRPLW